MSQKSLCVTYLLWALGGFIGLHHFYLKRDRQALIWWMFAGGYFGCGWIRDIWRIPTYVKDANDDPNYMEQLAAKMQKHQKPPSTTIRYCAQILVADAFGYLVISSIPRELIPEVYMPYAAVLAPFAVAVGIHLIGNIGREEGSFMHPLMGAYLTYPIYFWNINSVFWTSFASALCFNSYAKQWRRRPYSKRPMWRRLIILSLCGMLYLSLWGSFLYFNCTLTSESGEETKCRDAAKHFFRSPIWREFLSVMKEVWQFAQYHGWKEVWLHFVEAFDPRGQANALKVLDLTNEASQQEITARYRQLSRQWHPDKHHDAVEKELAQEKFIEINHAYEVLSNIKSHRVAQNVKACDTEHCE